MRRQLFLQPLELLSEIPRLRLHALDCRREINRQDRQRTDAAAHGLAVRAQRTRGAASARKCNPRATAQPFP